MIIDVHVHVAPEEVRENRERFLEGEPEFSLIYSDPRARLVGGEEVIEQMDRDGVDVSVIFGFPWRREETFRLNNDYVIEMASRFKGRLIPFCCLDFRNKNALKEVDRCFSLGAKGVGELALYSSDITGGAREELLKVARLCREADVPILLHTNEPVGHHYPGKSPMTLRALYELIKESPESRWILAHMGGGLPFFAYLKRECEEVLRNVYFDIAAMPFLYKPVALKVMMEAVGSDRFLLGTDFPLLPPSRYYRELGQSPLSEEEKALVLGKNANKLFRE